MKRILFFAALLFAVLAVAPAHSAAAPSNLVANPGYEDGFAAWDTVENWTLTDASPYGAHAASATVVQGAPALLCSKPYPAQGAPLSLRVSFKARGAPTNTNAGRGTALFMVRWLNGAGDRIGDSVGMSADGAPRGKWQTVRWHRDFLQEEGVAGFQICARAYAYGAKPFRIVLDEWSAGE